MLDTDIPSNYFVCRHNVFKTSSRHLFKTSSRHVFKTFARRFFKTSWDAFSVSIFLLPRHLQDVFEDVKLLRWRCAEDVFKTDKCLLGNDLNFNGGLKCINKRVNYDLKNLSNWLKANKISLNVGTTELVLFPSPEKRHECDLKIRLNGKRFYEIDSFKYLG